MLQGFERVPESESESLVKGLGFRVYDLGYNVEGLGLMVQG